MKPGKTKIFIFFLAGISLTFLIYSAIYIYLRNDDWMEHNAKSKFINYSTGYVYDEHTVELKRQYRDYFDFSSIEGFTLPGRLIEKKYWEIKNPKGSHLPKNGNCRILIEIGTKFFNSVKASRKQHIQNYKKFPKTTRIFPPVNLPQQRSNCGILY